jgi:hypothetical protein
MPQEKARLLVLQLGLVKREENALPSKRERRMTIRQKRKRRAKKKLAAGFKRVVERTSGRKKVRFVKPAAS